MRKFVRQTEMQAELGNEAHGKLKARNSPSDNRVSNIVTLDNGTMVEAFKYLNYCQLAKSSLVSQRYRDLIRTHRHKLALLYVNYIGISELHISFTDINIFNEKLSPEAYNEWVSRNHYSKEVPLESQISGMQTTQYDSKVYALKADTTYEDLNNREWNGVTTVLYAQVEVNHENWPVFEHFVRLATDPFIYIDFMNLTPQNDVLNMLGGSINSDRRLQCKILNLRNSQKSFTWAKNHVRCDKFSVYGEADLNQDDAFLDFLVTGGQCTSLINVCYHHVSEALAKFVQKFVNLVNWNEYQGVQSIVAFHFVKDQDIQVLKKDYSKFIVKEERDEDAGGTENVFEFINNAIGKKLQLTITIFDDEDDYWYSCSPTFSLKINNL